jgi:N-methylhydantoinase A
VPLKSLDVGTVEAGYADMESEAVAVLTDEGFGEANRRLVRTIDVRYSGQEHSVTVACPAPLGDDFNDIVEAAFSELHERQYGHVMSDPIEITTLRLQAIGVVDKPSLPKLEGRVGDKPVPGVRQVHVDTDEGAQYALYTRETLRSTDVIDGPAVITEHTATTVIHAGDTLRVGEHGELVISIADAGKEQE